MKDIIIQPKIRHFVDYQDVIKDKDSIILKSEQEKKCWNALMEIVKSKYNSSSIDSLDGDNLDEFIKAMTTSSIRDTIPEDLFMNKKKKYSNMIVKNKDSKILFLKRSKDSEFPEVYGLAGGKVEDNEDFAEAAIRETKEESGIDIESCIYKGCKDHDDESGSAYFEAMSDKEDVVLSKEHSDYRWASSGERSEMKLLKDTEDILKDLGY